MFEITIERIERTGEGAGSFNGRPVLVFGAFPGERVMVSPYHRRRGVTYARLEQVLIPIPERRKPQEDYVHLTGSPWQSIPEDLQLEYKKSFVDEAVEITPSPESWRYRNKLEFSFAENLSGDLSLAFHMRGSFSRMCIVEGSILGGKVMNECAKIILDELRRQGVHADQLKTLVIRESISQNACVAALYVKDKDIPQISVHSDELAGLHIIYSDPRSPASVATRLLYSTGSEILSEHILNLSLSYRYNSFFQVNPAAFTNLILEAKKYIMPGRILIDLYCGVGTVGLLLADSFGSVLGYEIDAGAVAMARKNAAANNISKAEFTDGPVERQVLEALASADTLVVDPPRSGLHPKVLGQILEHAPPNVVYISCNPETQQRDWDHLQDKYTKVRQKLFDFYPQTPHTESLLIMERRGI